MKLTSMHDGYTMNNGLTIPCLAFGTYIPKRQPQVHDPMIREAIRAGYRYFDTASLYNSERILGNAIKDSGVPREEFFVASKLWYDELDDPKAALERSLERLSMDYLDLYLIHWPMKPDEPDWKSKVVKVWQTLESFVDEGKVRSIGLSNFLPYHVEVILKNCRIKPVVDQLELHPGYAQSCAKAYLKEQGIIPQAWSAFARGAFTGKEGSVETYLNSLTEKYNKSLAQIFIRYQIDMGVIPIIKSADAKRMRDNFDVFDFELEQEDLWKIECMPQTGWSGEHPDFFIPAAASDPLQ